MKSVFAIFGMCFLSMAMGLASLIVLRIFTESRVIQSAAMEPNLHEWEHIAIEKVTTFLGKPYKRGEMILYYPPAVVMNGKDLSNNPLYVLGRLSGLPVFPYENASVTRVIGLPGERIRIEPSQGVYVNDQLLNERDYLRQPAHYQLLHLSDMGGQTNSKLIHPFDSPEDVNKDIIVPEGKLFVLCDNRDLSMDSHIYGFLDQHRVIGRAQAKWYAGKVFSWLYPPTYPDLHR